jgi:hypothetical protein
VLDGDDADAAPAERPHDGDAARMLDAQHDRADAVHVRAIPRSRRFRHRLARK